jgi:hypothetical protein
MNADEFDQIDEWHEGELKKFKEAKLSSQNAQNSSEAVFEIKPTDEKNKVVGIKDVVCDNDEITANVENQPIVLPIVKQEPNDLPRPEFDSNRLWTEFEGENGEKFISLVRYILLALTCK